MTIDYKGKITNTAEFNINEDQNEVTVTYSNGPTDEKAALRDRTSHYTFSIGAKALGQTEDSGKTWELVKVAADKDGNPIVEEKEVSSWSTKEKAHPLAGATFGLFTDENATIPYTNDLYPTGATFETSADGVITFKGLSAGIYYMKEISAPAGYVKDERIVKIQIECDYEDVHVDATTENGIKVAAYDYQVLKSYTVKVNNVSVYTESTSKYGQTDQTIESGYTFNNDGEKIDLRYRGGNRGPHPSALTRCHLPRREASPLGHRGKAFGDHISAPQIRIYLTVLQTVTVLWRSMVAGTDA